MKSWRRKQTSGRGWSKIIKKNTLYLFIFFISNKEEYFISLLPEKRILFFFIALKQTLYFFIAPLGKKYDLLKEIQPKKCEPLKHNGSFLEPKLVFLKQKNAFFGPFGVQIRSELYLNQLKNKFLNIFIAREHKLLWNKNMIFRKGLNRN